MDNVIVVESLSSNSVNGGRTDIDDYVNSQDLKCQVDLGSSITKCCVPNCSTSRVDNINSSQITFVTFPKDPSRFTEWIRAIGRPDLLCYLGKKEGRNLLICSKHFPENMWVNSNTRLKRLHKNAVPEKSYDDEIDIIAITPVGEKTLSKRGGIKVKKVTSLLTDSALRESLSSPIKTTSAENMLTSPPVVVDTLIDIKGRKLPLILPRPKSLIVSNNTPEVIKRSKTISHTPKILSQSKLKGPANKTFLEKKLTLENSNLKEELDKNMDYILNQKTHYEGLISKEKQTIKELEEKITSLESAQQKLWKSYENQRQTKKQAAEVRDLQNTIRGLQQINQSSEKELGAVKQTVSNMEAINRELQSQIEEFLAEKESESVAFIQTPTLVKPNFTGENFKEFLHLHLEKERQLEEKVNDLLIEIDKYDTPDGQKENLLNLSSRHLNHLHLSWLKWVLDMKERTEADFDERLREFALSIYEVSREAYVICAKAFGLPSPDVIKKWAKDPSSSKTTTSSTINALFDEAEALETKELLNKIASDSDIGYDDVLNSESKRRKRHWKQNVYSKKLKTNDDDEEGRVSDEDEQIVFTDSEEEEEDEEEDDDDELENEEEIKNIISKEAAAVDSKNRILSSKIEIPVASTSSQDFDFIVEEEGLEIGRGETSLVSENLQSEQQNHVDMPLLEDLDSPLTTPRRDSINGNAGPDLKISNRKKVISSDASLPSGSKVVFRVIES